MATLLETCEPLFQYICRLNRAGQKSATMEYATVRAEIKSLLDRIKNIGAADPRLRESAKYMEQPLTFFVDSMIAESKLPFAAQWHKDRLAYEKNELAGDEKFFDMLEETLRASGEEANDRLAIFYTCIGVGFCGWYLGQPEYLRKKMLEIAPRIRHLVDSDATARICPEAYEYTDNRNLIEPPAKKIGAIAIAFVVLTLTTLVANYYLFNKASQNLTDALRQIVAQDKNLGQLP